MDTATGFIPLLGGFFQISYVTRDLDAAMSQLATLYGIQHFRVKHDVQSLPGMPEMVIDQAHVFIGAMQIELIQPAGGNDALYRDFCAAESAAVRHHHFGCWVDTAAEYESLRSALTAQHIPVAFEARIPDVADVIYADMRATLGHYMEYVHMPPDVKRSYYANVPKY